MSSDGLDLRTSSKLNVPRLFIDISKFAAQIIQQARSSHIPLTDDCFTIHHLCEKVEYLLLFGLKSQNVRRFFQSKKSEPEYYTFLRSVCKQSKSLIDGLRYINVQHDLKTDTGRGRGLIRYFLTQNCLGDVLQTATADVKNLKLFYTDGALIRHGAMAHVVESLYALYNIQFSINPVSQNVSDLDINWPHMSSRILRIPQSVFPPPSSNPPSVPYHNPENIQKWLSSGIGSASDKPPSEKPSHHSISPKDADMEEKQEIMARVITDLELKNTHLETQLNITEAELKMKPEKTDRFLPQTPRLSELNDSILNQSRKLRHQMRNCSTPYSLAVPISPTSRTHQLLRSAVGLEFDTMSNVSETSDDVKKNESSTKLSDAEHETLPSGFEPLSTEVSEGVKFSEVYDSDMFPKSLIDGYHRQMEKCDERLIALEADNRIFREEKRRVEEECGKLREENDTLRDRLRELSETQSPTSGDFLAREVELLVQKVETLSSQLSDEKSRNSDLEQSLPINRDRKEISTQTHQKGMNIDAALEERDELQTKNDELSDRIASIDRDYARKIRDIQQEREMKVAQLESEINDLEEHVTCLDSDLSMKTRQCREIQDDVQRMTHQFTAQLTQQGRLSSLPGSPMDIDNFLIDYANYRLQNPDD